MYMILQRNYEIVRLKLLISFIDSPHELVAQGAEKADVLDPHHPEGV
jgi:hypothetical protein